jgi:hypothetical protein
LIVSIVVVLWLLFSWVAHMGRDNAQELAKAIQRGDDWSGQRAYELADLLRSPDPRCDVLRQDSNLAKTLADFLSGDLAEPVQGKIDQPRLMRRMYLCRAIGAFHVTDGLPALLTAAKQERTPEEIEVRFSALEALATLADNVGPERLREHAEVLPTVLAASRETDSEGGPPAASEAQYRPHAELRAVAAYALGVLGGEQASDRLRKMLLDPYPNARYNAATGLARLGDAACVDVLREMLDPDNPLAVQDEKYPDDQARKRTTVLTNGIKATLLLAENNPDADLAKLKAALNELTAGTLEKVVIDRAKVQTTAREALRLLEASK